MPRFLDKLVKRMELWAIRRSEVGRFDGIGLADLRGHPASFRQTIESSLRLIRENDPRRYARVRRHICWIANRMTNSMGEADYESDIRVCNLEFSDTLRPDQDTTAALWACVIVHEATHGAIGSRGIRIGAHNRIRIERLCVAEENRFGARLSELDAERYPANLLHQDFRAGYWHQMWTASPLKKRLTFISRWFADR